MNRAIAAVAAACGSMLLTAACATSSPEPRRANPSTSSEDCLFSTFVEDWTPIDNQTFILYGPGRHPYLGRLAFPSPDLTLSLWLVVVDDDRNGRICGQAMDSVTFRDPVIPGKIFIDSLREITEEEANALLANSKQARKRKPPPEVPPEKSSEPQ